jgi:hypothetical protein
MLIEELLGHEGNLIVDCVSSCQYKHQESPVPLTISVPRRGRRQQCAARKNGLDAHFQVIHALQSEVDEQTSMAGVVVICSTPNTRSQVRSSQRLAGTRAPAAFSAV